MNESDDEVFLRMLSELESASDVLENIRNQFEVLLSKLDKALASAKGGPQTFSLGKGPAIPSKQGGSTGKAESSDAMANMQGFASALEASTAAALAFVAAPPLMVAAVTPFVQAFNPGLVEQFGFALRGLQATLGSGLEPVLQIASKTVGALAASFVPVVTAMKPLLTDLALTLNDLVMAFVDVSVQMFNLTSLVIKPLVYALSTVVRWAAQVADVLAVVAGVAFDMLQAWLEAVGVIDGSADLLKGFKDVLNHCVTGLAFLTLAVMKLAGAAMAVSKVREALEKKLNERKTGAGGVAAAPKDVGISGIEDVAKKLTERAFAAQGGAASKSDNDLLQELVTAAQDVEKWDLAQMIEDAVYKGMNRAKESVKESARSVASEVKDASSGPLSLIGGPLLTLAGGAL